jgi:hypothetical protein
MREDEKTPIEEFLHKEFMKHRPEKLLVATRTDKPKKLALRPGQRRYLLAAKEIAKMPEWIRVEMYDTSNALIGGINADQIENEEEQWSVHDEHMHLLNLLSLNNYRQAKLYAGMFGDILENYKELAANSVDRAIQSERAWIKALGEIADLSVAPTNGETGIDMFMGKIFPKLLDKFQMGGGDLAGLKGQIDSLEKRANALKGKKS